MPTLHIRLLGAFRLTYGDEPVAGVTTPRLQSLLAYLIVHRDSPQLRQQLAFLFWPDSSEAQARNNLRQAIHGLRLALPFFDAFILADSHALQWRPDAPFILDVAEFDLALTLADQAERQLDAATQRVALARAVGAYTADLLPSCYDDWIAPERERLRQRYLHALDQFIQLLEAEQDYEAAIGHARMLVRHDALNERAYRWLMRLLARNGDRAGALRVYHACATALQRELGIAPSPETQEAYERLVRGAGESSLVEQARRPLAISSSLIGREHEWARAHALWGDTCAGSAGFALITGEAGIGKSRLAEDLTLWVHQQGATTAKTRCYDAEGRLSLAPVTEWLRSEAIRPHLGRLSPIWLAEVARVLPELLSEYTDLPRVEPIGEYGQRQRFFEALARAVGTAPRPMLLLIDDLQWCDEETLEWLHFLLRYTLGAQLLVVGTARMEEIGAEHPLRALLRRLGHMMEVTEIPLRPLDAAESARLAGLIAHRTLDVDMAMRLFRETEGNPLFVVEMMRAGLGSSVDGEQRARSGQTDTAPGDAPTLPPRVQAVIAGRLAHLSPAARELTALAATIGHAFRLDVLARAAASDEDSAVRALDELWQKRIVREQGINSYDFTHDKLREVAYAEVSAPQRRLLHRRIAQAIEDVYDGDLDPVSGQLASHYERAGQTERAIAYYQQAAAVAQRVYANEDAINLLSRALELLEHLPGGAQRDKQELNLQLALAPFYRITRGWTAPELEHVVHRTLVLCDAVGDDTQRAEALYGYQSLLVVQAKLQDVQRVSDELQDLYARAHDEPPPLSGMMRAGALFHLGEFVTSYGECERMIASSNTTQARFFLDAQGWNHAAHTRAWQSHTLWCLGYPEQALRRGMEAVQLARDLALPFNQALTTTYLAMLQQLRADPATAKAQAEEALSLTLEYKAPYYRSWAGILVDYGDALKAPDTARLARLCESIANFKVSGARLRLPYYHWLVAQVCRKLGMIDEGLAQLREALDASQVSGEHWWDSELHRLRSELLLARGSSDDETETGLLQALEIARMRQAKSLELRAAISLAQLWRRRRADDALRLLGEVYAWFTEGFDTPDLLAARSLLTSLA